MIRQDADATMSWRPTPGDRPIGGPVAEAEECRHWDWAAGVVVDPAGLWWHPGTPSCPEGPR